MECRYRRLSFIIQSRLISLCTIKITLNKVKGELILDTKGMTKQEIENIVNIQAFTVETGQK
jgi:hypothetical protein